MCDEIPCAKAMQPLRAAKMRVELFIGRLQLRVKLFELLFHRLNQLVTAPRDFEA